MLDLLSLTELGKLILAAILLSLLILYGVRRIKIFFHHDVYTLLTLKFRGINGPLEQVKNILSEYRDLSIQFTNFQQSVLPQIVTYRLRLVSREFKDWGEVVKRLSEMKGLEEISWEEGEVP